MSRRQSLGAHQTWSQQRPSLVRSFGCPLSVPSTSDQHLCLARVVAQGRAVDKFNWSRLGYDKPRPATSAGKPDNPQHVNAPLVLEHEVDDDPLACWAEDYSANRSATVVSVLRLPRPRRQLQYGHRFGERQQSCARQRCNLFSSLGVDDDLVGHSEIQLVLELVPRDAPRRHFARSGPVFSPLTHAPVGDRVCVGKRGGAPPPLEGPLKLFEAVRILRSVEGPPVVPVEPWPLILQERGADFRWRRVGERRPYGCVSHAHNYTHRTGRSRETERQTAPGMREEGTP